MKPAIVTLDTAEQAGGWHNLNMIRLLDRTVYG